MSDFSADNMAIGNGPKPFAPRPDTPASGVAGLPTNSLPGSPSSAPAHAAPSQPAHRASTPEAGPGQGQNLGQQNQGQQDQGPNQAPAPGQGQQGPLPEVKGRIEVADEVVEKVAGLACMEVAGVADLGGDFERALESVREKIGIGNKRGDQGIKAKINGREVSIDVTIMIEYGHVVMDVARAVKANVAAQTSRMLGLKVVEVNVTVDDVRMPGEKKRADGDAEAEAADSDVENGVVVTG
ncbi:MAG TPA: Asp23/Gls24 family envelope stress response protein [Acidimicrobiales bacterium]